MKLPNEAANRTVTNIFDYYIGRVTEMLNNKNKKVKYLQGEEVYVLSLNTLAIVDSCILVGDEEFYKLKLKENNPINEISFSSSSSFIANNVLFSANDLYLPKNIKTKKELIRELFYIQRQNINNDIKKKMKTIALLEYIDDVEVIDAFYI